MYSNEELKKIYQKAKSENKRLLVALANSNTICYTEQNQEELNAAKEFIKKKLDITSQIMIQIKQVLSVEENSNRDNLLVEVSNCINNYNLVNSDPYLTRLQNIYAMQDVSSVSL